MAESVEPGFPDMYRGCRALVTGASGFIGAWVAKKLVTCGAQVWAAGRSPEALQAAFERLGFVARGVCADLAERGQFAGIFLAARPDITFHLTGYGVDPAERDGQLAERINAGLVAEIAQTIAQSGASAWPGLRLVHAGSGAEYGTVEGTVSEDSPARPVSLYGSTKLAGTLALRDVIRRTGLRATTARLFIVYGPGEHATRLLPGILAAAKTGNTLAMTAGEQLRDFTYVEDVAEGLLRLGCITGAAPDVVNLASGRQTTVREFAEAAGRLAGLAPSQLQFGALPYRADEVRQGRVDVGLLRRLAGWVPPAALEDGLKRAIGFRPESRENK